MSAVKPLPLSAAEDKNSGESNSKCCGETISKSQLFDCFRTNKSAQVATKLFIEPSSDSNSHAQEHHSAHISGRGAELVGRRSNVKVRRRLMSFINRIKCSCSPACRSTIAPQSLWYLSWLGLLTVCYLYNILTIILRTAFQPEGYYSQSNYHIWMAVDYVCDVIYLIDLIAVKPRVQFIRNGLLQTEVRNTMRHYVRGSCFKFDLLSLLPLDLFYLYTGVFQAAPLLRLPRYLKLRSAWEFFDRCDQISKSGYVVRVVRTMIYMLFLIHVETCGYYAISHYEGIGSNQWVFQGEGIAYIRCFYLATKTATSIGNNPKPTNQIEYMFMTVYWLSGVFVFALLIGQIRDIFESANSVKSSYQKAQDSTLQYLQNLNVPKQVQSKVRDWFNYNWEQQKTLNENLLVDVLPNKMKTDLFLSVHVETLEHVSLFKNVDRSLLSDLILKLVPVIFLPGDIICRKGEVGTEMYIVMHGQVEVVADDGTKLATLTKGNVFGEISLMGLAGGNRRTAHVRSKGYSNLFVLSKYDFDEAMQDYPAAYMQLRKRAQKLLTKTPANKKKVQSVSIISESAPKGVGLFSTTLQSMVTQLMPISELPRNKLSAAPEPSMADDETDQKVKESAETIVNEVKLLTHEHMNNVKVTSASSANSLCRQTLTPVSVESRSYARRDGSSPVDDTTL